jgi:hypothetical protein
MAVTAVAEKPKAQGRSKRYLRRSLTMESHTIDSSDQHEEHEVTAVLQWKKRKIDSEP